MPAVELSGQIVSFAVRRSTRAAAHGSSCTRGTGSRSCFRRVPRRVRRSGSSAGTAPGCSRVSPNARPRRRRLPTARRSPGAAAASCCASARVAAAPASRDGELAVCVADPSDLDAVARAVERVGKAEARRLLEADVAAAAAALGVHPDGARHPGSAHTLGQLLVAGHALVLVAARARPAGGACGTSRSTRSATSSSPTTSRSSGRWSSGCYPAGASSAPGSGATARRCASSVRSRSAGEAPAIAAPTTAKPCRETAASRAPLPLRHAGAHDDTPSLQRIRSRACSPRPWSPSSSAILMPRRRATAARSARPRRSRADARAG